MATKRTRTEPSTHWELYCPKKTRTCLTLADSSNRPSEQLPLLFCCSFVHAAWRAEPALSEHYFGSPGCPAQLLSKNQRADGSSGNGSSGTASPLREADIHTCLYICLSVCLTTWHRATGFMHWLLSS